MGLARISPMGQTEVSQSAPAVRRETPAVARLAWRLKHRGQMPGYFRTVCPGSLRRRRGPSPQSIRRHHACFAGRRDD